MQERTRTYPSLWESIGLIIRLFLLYLIWGFISAAIIDKSGIAEDSTLEYIFKWILPNIVAGGIIIWYSLYRAGSSWSALWIPGKIQRSLYPFLFLLLFGQALFIMELTLLVQYVFPMPGHWIRVFKEILGQNLFIVLVAVAVIAGIVEEIIFRGIILKGFLQRYSPRTSIMISSILFAIIHLNIVQCISAFIIGLTLGWLFYKTSSLLLVIIAHAFHNTLFVLVYRYLNVSLLDGVEEMTSGKFFISGLILYGIALYILARIWQKNDSKKGFERD